ncbi:unnamed protein product [Penicillium manginii]
MVALNIFLGTAASLAALVIATPTTTAPTTTEALEPHLDIIMVDSPPSDPTRFVPSVRSKNDNSRRAQQEAYENDCLTLLTSMERSHTTITFAPEQSKDFFTSHRICKFTVRNQQKASCSVKTQSVNRATMGKSLGETLDACPSLGQNSGWGFITGKPNLVYIVEPHQLAPPSYSPSCEDGGFPGSGSGG